MMSEYVDLVGRSLRTSVTVKKAGLFVCSDNVAAEEN